MKIDRVIDANLNRAEEALRVLEDAARFVLCDNASAEKAKHLRHTLHGPMDASIDRLLTARQARSDGTAHLNPPSEMNREGFPALIAANAKRAQQALRSLEEFSKLPEAVLTQNAGKFKRIRFEVYELEKELAGKASRHNRRECLHGLYVILDPEITGGRDIAKIAKQALAGGARIVQLRDKRPHKGRKLELCRKLKDMAAEGGALFFINDDADIALAAQADGIHLGQSDLPVKEARRLLPIGGLIGCSVHNAREALRAEKDGADYVSIGCLFPTRSKIDVHPTSLETLREIKKAVRLPLAGIGGINKENIAEVYQAGADMACVISAVGLVNDPSGMTRLLSRSQTKTAIGALRELPPAGSRVQRAFRDKL